MELYVPCPSCNYQAINGNFEKYETDAMCWDFRCTRCNCLFKLKFGIEMNVYREGKKNA